MTLNQNTMSKKHIKWHKVQNYDVREGPQRCEVVSLYELKERENCAAPIRILFAPVGQIDLLKQSVVAKTYCTDEDSEQFTRDIRTILGGKLHEHLDAEGNFDSSAVEGRVVDVVVKNYHGTDHEKPFTYVSDVFSVESRKAS